MVHNNVGSMNGLKFVEPTRQHKSLLPVTNNVLYNIWIELTIPVIRNEFVFHSGKTPFQLNLQ